MPGFRLCDGADSCTEVAHPEGEDNRQDAHDDCEDGEHPGDGQDTGDYVLKDQDAENDGEQAGEDQPPLIVNLLAHAKS